jgi:hypothetical protein
VDNPTPSVHKRKKLVDSMFIGKRVGLKRLRGGATITSLRIHRSATHVSVAIESNA